VGGTATSGEQFPAVGALIRPGPFGGLVYVCTATLITEDVVLTAGHCLRETDGDEFTFVFGSDPLTSDLGYAATWTLRHPDYSVDVEAGTLSNDVALVGLSEPVLGVEPLRLSDTAPRVGAPVELVGYGGGSPEDSERRMNTGHSTIAAVSATEMRVGDGDSVQNCTGDSGGPALSVDDAAGRSVIGVVSRGAEPTKPCHGGGIHSRVDAYLDFVREGTAQRVASAASGSCHVGGPRGQGPAGLPVILALSAATIFLVRGRIRTLGTTPSAVRAGRGWGAPREN
jgi:secreted trypsin-like serine protease